MITGPGATTAVTEPTGQLRFSIVIATLNRATFLPACLASVLSQRWSDYEVIVVDGGSTDGTAAILASFGSRLRVINERGGGPGGARNVGVEVATGNYVVFVDSDDVLASSALGLYDAVLSRLGDPAILLASHSGFSTESELHSLGAKAPADATFERFSNYLEAALQGHLSGAHRLVIDRAVFQRARGFDSRLRVCEDQDFGLRIGDVGPCGVILDPPTVGYRAHAGNISSSVADFRIGANWLIDAEKSGAYPGGRRWEATRRAIITRTVRSVSIACLDRGQRRDGLRIYRKTWPWHLRQLHLKYLVGFPAAAVAPFSLRGSPR